MEDLCATDEFAISEVLKAHGIVSLANVPILGDGAAWGVLEIDSSIKRVFDDDVLDFLSAAAAVIGAALQWHFAVQIEADAAATVAAQIQNREVLLREIQHRVKNNFQIIQASISLQKRRFPSGDVHRALDHIANRINAVSLAHDQLTPQQNLHSVDLAGYLRALCSYIERQVENVSFDVQVDEVELGIDRAIPLGLIVNEAVTNSMKHAFDGKGGRITVRLTTGIGYGQARLAIANNGRGIQNPRSDGTGLKLISLLTKQISGESEQSSEQSRTSIKVTFPVIV